MNTENIEINEKFKKAFDFVENTTKPLFVTGKAGTGKSTLLKLIREQTRKQVVVVAPTGVAAVNIKGQTIHSFFGFKPDVTLDKARDIAKKANTKVYKSMELLIIDEISMVRADLFDCIDQFLRIVRKSFEPFGGVQLLIIGDLFQLPPVLTNQDRDHILSTYASPYFFSAHVMKEIGFSVLSLDKIYRQSDLQFVTLLNKIRENSIEEQDLEILNKQVVTENYDIGNAICLTTTNDRAEVINKQKMWSISAEEIDFKGKFTGEYEKSAAPVDEILSLKLGAQVMLVTNDAMGRWVNGTIGTVIQLEQDREGELIRVQLQDGQVIDVFENTWEMYEFTIDEKTEKVMSKSIGTFSQYPLKLAWAMTIHKSQGKTFDSVVIDLGRGAFAPGQVYVALSRAKTLQGIRLLSPVRRRDIWTDKRIVAYFGQIKTR